MGQEANLDNVKPTNSQPMEDASALLFNEAYVKCPGGGPGAKCSPQPLDADSSSLPIPELKFEKQGGAPKWLVQSDRNHDKELSLTEVRSALAKPQTRDVEELQVLRRNFDKVAGDDDLVSIAEIEKFLEEKYLSL